MIQKKDWIKAFAVLLFITLMGAYYDRLTMESRTMALPIVIIFALAFFIARLKQFEHEINSSKITTTNMI